MRWGKGRQYRGARGIVGEAERILQGRTLESYISRRERVPAWTLIALLGHASRADLMRLAYPASPPEPAGWSGTVARLASDLLLLTWDEHSLIRLQRRSLIPLELNLLAGITAPPCTPFELHEMVTGAVERPLSPEF
ncbi:MAG: hypothetical protein KGQ66_11400 [Acidobacteriota bacterium]|nr:hypothetical protein [Acidobacteriota bacterium]